VHAIAAPREDGGIAIAVDAGSIPGLFQFGGASGDGGEEAEGEESGAEARGMGAHEWTSNRLAAESSSRQVGLAVGRT